MSMQMFCMRTQRQIRGEMCSIYIYAKHIYIYILIYTNRFVIITQGQHLAYPRLIFWRRPQVGRVGCAVSGPRWLALTPRVTSAGRTRRSCRRRASEGSCWCGPQHRDLGSLNKSWLELGPRQETQNVFLPVEKKGDPQKSPRAKKSGSEFWGK